MVGPAESAMFPAWRRAVRMTAPKIDELGAVEFGAADVSGRARSEEARPMMQHEFRRPAGPLEH
jgi:hypothetical protein